MKQIAGRKELQCDKKDAVGNGFLEVTTLNKVTPINLRIGKGAE